MHLEADILQHDDKFEEASTVLYHASQILRADLRECSGLETSPLNPNDITNSNASNIIPDSLFKFLQWMLETDRGLKKASSVGENEPRQNASTDKLE